MECYFLGMAAMPFPPWSSFDTVDDSLASFTFTKKTLGFFFEQIEKKRKVFVCKYFLSLFYFYSCFNCIK